MRKKVGGEKKCLDYTTVTRRILERILLQPIHRGRLMPKKGEERIEPEFLSDRSWGGKGRSGEACWIHYDVEAKGTGEACWGPRKTLLSSTSRGRKQHGTGGPIVPLS